MNLQGKNILVGVTGGIAAYKTALLIRLLVKAGAQVKVVMTPCAPAFITPLTLSTLSKNTVYQDFAQKDGTWNNHVELGLWCDLMIIAPATANTMGKLANGICDNFLLATCLSLRSSLLIAPAMDVDMYGHPAVKKNIQTLQSFGYDIMETGTGELASGLHGQGRMAEPEQIFERIVYFFKVQNEFINKKVLVTAGPTYEAIDPVRFIGNHSSGKMGYAIANEFARRGAEVTLISGPVNTEMQTESKVNVVRIQSAAELFDESTKAFSHADVAVCAAAVADYRPVYVADKKIKKQGDNFTLELEKTPDTLAELGSRKKNNQVLVGFALETDNELANAGKKLSSKNLDLIVLNSLNDKGAGFGHATNKVTIIDRNNKARAFELKTKEEVASDLADIVSQLLTANK